MSSTVDLQGSAQPPQGEPVIEVEDVRRVYGRPRSGLFGKAASVTALDGVSLTVHRGEKLGIVGESGCGKSTLLRIVAGLHRPTSGRVRVEGREVTGSDRDLAWLRRRLQVVFQDPMSSLDPRMRVGDIIAEPLVGLRVEGDHRARVAELLEAVGLDAEAAERYPHMFSGGQRQRISIARALAPRPQVLLADEPVSALDVSVRAQVLNVVERLVADLDLTLVFVSHDLSVVRHVCERVVVMTRGRIVEEGPTEQVYTHPRHDYTKALVAAVPSVRRALTEERGVG
ncbi:ATP-binding cassette domain-containing protein [Arsenicicoccus piscis]|uniref:ABC transporter ATP-binding protein n=1 Tax=Arsenicicoccus piscis TaxID=673954 RepID=A0ABQ6HL69_9MICO|nr:ATP-binding cassette domain-containing protein [Arsenicicoccus piscis]MCH8627139.1 ATP-binding cassette domain-containing protein [Arsenicicoccus piscis]GMA18907.1 ABC transporter ATP-binding protein [Arsenicicoccus piscis]